MLTEIVFSNTAHRLINWKVLKLYIPRIMLQFIQLSLLLVED
ncbi:hypothetical protein MtrunA17_Chr4g0045651 [Medicago truncatula]|uniref:Uncharacterized protein n=1 Tax=Medicago truncatula TaxID=3880 RepID=A0A396I9I9_MEDTR|nr:hypothetical protein MtrunA17_Chr4g0045651 [Medicago truncatula]